MKFNSFKDLALYNAGKAQKSSGHTMVDSRKLKSMAKSNTSKE